MNLDLSRSHLEELLAGFLTGALNLTPGARITDVDKLPEAYRARLRPPDSNGRIWAAWETDLEPVILWAEYDIAASHRLAACVLFIEWYGMSVGKHGLWCYCYPKRPTEWIAGRGDNR
jgi:hypothetical protein